MKILEKITLVLFANLMLILSVIAILLIVGWLQVSTVSGVITYIINEPIASNVLLGISIIFILLAIKCIFFDNSSKKDEMGKDGVLLENADGKLLISKETLENLIDGVVKGFSSAQNSTTKVELDEQNNVKVFITLFVGEDAVIKELSTNLQAKIKETIKKASDLEVKEVNIRVKNIAPKKENNVE